MGTRQIERERFYKRRIRFSLGASVLVNGLLMVTLPGTPEPGPQARIAQPGPLRVVPELDIEPDVRDESRLSGAKTNKPPTDFVALEVEYEEQVRPREFVASAPRSPEMIGAPDPFKFSTVEDLQNEIRTTGHPVLAQSDIQIVHLVRPIYPRKALREGVHGTLELMILVGVDGRVSEMFVVNPHQIPILEDAAVGAVRQWRFNPFEMAGVPTAFWVRIPVEFRLVD